MDYKYFIEQKRHSSIDLGIEPVFIPESMFDFQKAVSERLIKKGRAAGFLDTGLGKTLIELVIAQNYLRETNKNVLIICPLAVAFQIVKEADSFGIEDVSYSKDGVLKSKIVVCNYERLDKFFPTDFDCVILDESSILKNFDGAIKQSITSFLKKIKYRFLFTATPSPNDYIELGTSSEALGYMGYTDMLGKFFRNNNNSIDVRHAGCEWYLKPHAEQDFWRWVAGWSVSMRKPSDIGFSDDRFVLPELKEITTAVKNESPLAVNGQMQLFNHPAKTFFEIKSEVKSTVQARCEMAVEKANKHETSVYWVNRNDESETILKLDKNAVEVCGKMSLDEKEEVLLAFSNGGIKHLVTKPTITAFGLNWQHCNHTTFFPTYSYEQYYQAIRRFWRFGQKKPVIVDQILSDGQSRIMESLEAKKEKAISMFQNLTENANQKFELNTRGFDNPVSLPKFLMK